MLIHHTTTNQFRYGVHNMSKYLRIACNSRNNYPKSPEKIRERSTIQHPKMLKPIL